MDCRFLRTASDGMTAIGYCDKRNYPDPRCPEVFNEKGCKIRDFVMAQPTEEELMNIALEVYNNVNK